MQSYTSFNEVCIIFAIYIIRFCGDNTELNLKKEKGKKKERNLEFANILISVYVKTE